MLDGEYRFCENSNATVISHVSGACVEEGIGLCEFEWEIEREREKKKIKIEKMCAIIFQYKSGTKQWEKYQ